MTPLARTVVRFLLLVAAYFTAAAIALGYVKSHDDVTLIWPPAGIVFGALLVYGWRWWPFAAVAMLLTHWLLAPVPWLFLPYSIASNVVGGVVGASFVHRFYPRALQRLSLNTGWVLMSAGALMALTSAAIGSLGMLHAQMVDSTLLVPSALRWLMGDLFGIIALTPAVLMVLLPTPRILGAQSFEYGGIGEKLALVLGLACAIGLVLWAGDSSNGYSLALASVPLAALILSAVRFEPTFTAIGNALMSILLASAAGLGLAGFSPPETLGDSALLTLFMCVIALIPQMLSVTIFENRLASARLIRRATTDALTGLANRTAFESRVGALLRSGGSEAMTLAYIDLDRFRIINDTLGHAAGDALIVALSGVLGSRLQREDILARVGGDAFSVLLRNCDAETAQRRAQDLGDAVAGYRFVSGEHVATSSASIGVVSFHADAVEFGTLLAQADTACFAAKERGGNRVVAVEPGITGVVQERSEAMRWALRIGAALEHDHFRLYCQTIAPLRLPQQDSLRHFEILLRMRDPDSGELLLPGQFVPAAERFGLGVRLDRHVIDRTLRWFERHPDGAARVNLCSINLTAASIEDESFLPFLQARLQRSALPAHKLCFELTETTALRDLGRAQALIQSVRALGCRFALDDFGTGFCSFGYLRSLDVDFFKIDGSFVRDIASSTLSYAIVRSIADIGRVMRKQTIAECAENDSVRQRLADLGVDFAQGYAIEMPEPIERYFGTARRLAVT